MRLFVALQPTDPARDALAALADDVSGVRWVPAAQLHLTLRFIGEVSEGDAERSPRRSSGCASNRFFSS